MKSQLIHSLTGDFESFAHKTPESVERKACQELGNVNYLASV